MRALLLVAAVTLAACGGDAQTVTTTAPTPDQLAACDAVQRTLDVAVEAFTLGEEREPTSIDEMIPEYVDPEQTVIDWFTLDGVEVVPAAESPCP